jgi:chromosome segregation ATPase
MKKTIDYELVKEACKALEVEGSKVTARNINARIGGSMTTVVRHLKRYQEEVDAAAKSGTTRISEDVLKAIIVEIGKQTEEIQQTAKERVDQAQNREKEVLRELEQSEEQVQSLKGQLCDVNEQLAHQCKDAEKTKALASEKIEGLSAEVQTLRAERQHLIESGEVARTETAKVKLQIERADDATQKAEQENKQLREQVKSLISEKNEAEKIAAVMEAKFESEKATTADLRERLNTAYDQIKSDSLKHAESLKQLQAQAKSDLDAKSKSIEKVNIELMESLKRVGVLERDLAQKEGELCKR